MKPSTVNAVLAAGRAAFHLAWKRGELQHVPPISKEPVGPQEPMGQPLSVDQARRLVELSARPDCQHLHDFIVLALGTAARPGAVLELTAGQMDFERKLIDLNPSGRAQNKKLRPIVKMPDRVAERFSAAQERSGAAPVVAYQGGAVRSLKTSWRKLRERAGLDDGVTTYSFRHTMARHLRAEGVPAWEVAAQLGHKTAGVTDRYAPFSPDYLRNAILAIDAYLDRVGV